MNRQDLRNPYPFHNPRAAVRCCSRHAHAHAHAVARPPFDWSKLARAAALLAVVLVVVKETF